jgi:hypothetical protein
VSQSQHLAKRLMFFSTQLWGFIGTCAFTIAFLLHPLFFIIGLVETFPFIFTEYVWPVVKNVLLSLIAVKLLSVVFEVFLSPFLVSCSRQPQFSF